MNSVKRFFAIVVMISVILPVFVLGRTVNAATNITIDGLYDDWKNVPSVSISHGSSNGKDVHKFQLYTDDDYLYIHVKLSNEGNTDMPFGQFNLKINNLDQEFHIYDGGGYHSNKAPSEPGQYSDLFVGVRGQGNGWNAKKLTGSVVYTVYQNRNHKDDNYKGSEFELKVKLSDLAAAYGISKEAINTITLTNSSLGSQGATIAGTSTGPVILTIIVAAIAVTGYVVWRKSTKLNKAVEAEGLEEQES